MNREKLNSIANKIYLEATGSSKELAEQSPATRRFYRRMAQYCSEQMDNRIQEIKDAILAMFNDRPVAIVIPAKGKKSGRKKKRQPKFYVDKVPSLLNGKKKRGRRPGRKRK